MEFKFLMAYRYLGNKTRISDWIADHIIAKIGCNATIADPMCGTASMSETFAMRGLKVLASDQLRFPVLHAKARLFNYTNLTFKPVAKSYEEALNILNNLDPVEGFFSQEYSEFGNPTNTLKPRKYFTSTNAAKIDAIREQISKWRKQGLEDNLCDLLLHDLILAVNKVANIAGTYGYYCSKWTKNSLNNIRLQKTVNNTYNHEHVVIQGKVEDIASTLNVNACYLDPPYTKRQYAGNYHILETLALEDFPIPVGDGGLRDWKKDASDYCYKRYAKEAFKKTIENLNVEWIFISYSEDGQVSPDDLYNVLSEYGDVIKEEIEINRYISNKAGAKKSRVQEHLYILKKNG